MPLPEPDLQRIVVVTNLPRPYRHALFNEVARLLAGRADLIVVYCADAGSDPRRKHVRSSYDDAAYTRCTVTPMRLGTTGDKVWSAALGLPVLLRRLRPAAVVAGGFGIDAVLCHATCRALSTPTVLWNGDWPRREVSVSQLQSAVRRALVPRASACLAYGSRARDYLVSLGADPQRVSVAVNTVDLERFATTAEAARSARREAGNRFGLRDHNLLYVGGLNATKGAPEALRAFARLDAHGVECALHVVGVGPLADELERVAREPGANKCVRFHGFLQGDDVACLAGVCDAFVFPTRRDVWGLVLNEAMACRLPVLASDRAGATTDLIVDGVNGYVIDPDDLTGIAAKVETVLADPVAAAAMGRRALASVRERASLARAAEGFVRGIDIALGRARSA